MPQTSERPTWPQQLNKRFESDYQKEGFSKFLSTIARMEIAPTYVQGRVAVIGQGPEFPERSLLCSDKNFHTLIPAISLLVTFDGAFASSPEIHLNNPIRSDPEGHNLTQMAHGTVAYYSWGASYAMRTYEIPKNFFNTVFAFQIPDLGKQMEGGLLASITAVLNPHGHFIGSGGTLEGYYEKIEQDANNPMRILQKVRLPNPGHMGYSFNEHLGIILEKR